MSSSSCPGGNSGARRTRGTGHRIEYSGLDISNRRETARPLSAMSSDSLGSNNDTLIDQERVPPSSSPPPPVAGQSNNVQPEMMQMLQTMQTMMATFNSILPQLVEMCAASTSANVNVSGRNPPSNPEHRSAPILRENFRQSSPVSSRASTPHSEHRRIPSKLVEFPSFQPDEDILAFIDKVESAADLLDLDDNSLVRMVLHNLDSKTYHWARLECAKYARVTWNYLKIALLKKSGIRDEASLQQKMRNRQQMPGEKITDYVVAKLVLIDRVDEDMAEEMKIQLVRKGLHANVRKYLTGVSLTNLDHFKDALYELELDFNEHKEYLEKKEKRSINFQEGKKNFNPYQSPKGDKRKFPRDYKSYEGQSSRTFNSKYANHSRKSSPEPWKNKPKGKDNGFKKRDKDEVVCYNCFEPGHFSRRCPHPMNAANVNYLRTVIREKAKEIAANNSPSTSQKN